MHGTNAPSLSHFPLSPTEPIPCPINLCHHRQICILPSLLCISIDNSQHAQHVHFFFSVRRADSVTSRIFSFPIQDPVPADPTDAIYFFPSARFRPAILTVTRNRPRNTTTTGPTHPRQPRLIDRGAPSRTLTLRRLWDPQAHPSDPRQSHPPARDILRCRARPRTGRHRPSCQHWHGPSRPFLDPRHLPQV